MTDAKKSNTRVYRLAPTEHNDGPNRLVEATSEAQAYRHIARKSWVATVATQTDLIDLVGAGVKVEKAATE